MPIKPNERQQEAINALQGPVMLLAGPGTGKTFTLVRRVENMLNNGIKPESILCLTFSDAATSEMKSRLVSSLGVIAASVNVATYHGFCSSILKEYPSEFELPDNILLVDEITKQAILKEAVDEVGEIEFLKDKWGNKYFYISSILSSIDVIKRERVTKEQFFNYIDDVWQKELDELNIEQKERELKKKVTKTHLAKITSQINKMGKAREFYKIFEIYSKKLSQSGFVDYSDMINLVLNKWREDKDFLIKTTKDFKYLLVDEYQDTSTVQNEIIFNILEGMNSDNVFVVGDDDQIIYSFQGAKTSTLFNFLEKFKNTKIICLVENRRSTQTILDFADLIISKSPLRMTKIEGVEKKLTAKNEEIIKKDRKIDFNIFTETVQENNFIVNKIEELRKDGVKLSEIAVLARKNTNLDEFARLLKQKGIPFVLSKQKNAFEVPSFIQTYSLLKLISNSFIEQDKLFSLLNYEPFKIEEKTLAKILYKVRTTSLNWFQAVEQLALNPDLEDKKFVEFYKMLTNFKQKKSVMPLIPFLYNVIFESKILAFYSNYGDNRFENISAVERLMTEAKSFQTIHQDARLDDFIKHLDTYFKENIKIELDKPLEEADAVRLLTYHGSKGREFEYVFMPDLCAKTFEKASKSSNKLELPINLNEFQDEEMNLQAVAAEHLRLLFVGITRAKFGLILSYSNNKGGSPQTCTTYITSAFPDADSLVLQKSYQINSDQIYSEIVNSYDFKPKTDFLDEEIKARINDIILSQTSLNRYLSCPLSYFYSDILKVPVFLEDKDILSYGSSIHSSIRKVTLFAQKEGKYPDVSFMKDAFLNEISYMEFTNQSKREEFIQRGIKSIEENYAKLTEFDPKHILQSEYKMELDYKGVKLKGFADRISVNNQGEILIYDFKTGSYKKVKDGENYYNQLRFYKFLYEEMNKNSKVAQTSLIFFEQGCKSSSIEPDNSNNSEIKQKIDFCIEGIKNFNFDPVVSADNCKYCSYTLVCKMFIKSKE